MARLFVAAPLPDEVMGGLRDLDRSDPGVRWVPESQWHVTLRFLGDDADVEAATRAVGDLHAPAAAVELGPAVRLLGRRVVCVPAAGLDRLAAAVADATADVAAGSDAHPFHGHVTLGRVRARGAAPSLVGTPWASRFVADRVTLIESRLGAGPARHRVVVERPLEAPPA